MDAVQQETPRLQYQQVPDSLQDKKDIIDRVLRDGQQYFNNYTASRREYELQWRVCDYMYKGAQNRSINEAEMSKGANLKPNAERANTGSTLFHRQINQTLSAALAVLKSQPVPYKYKPIVNDGVFLSPEDGMKQADQWNCLLRWNLQQDDFSYKSHTMWFQLLKYGNHPVLCEWKREEGDRETFEPMYDFIQNPATGTVEIQVVGQKKVTRRVVTKNLFAIRGLQIESLVADPYIPNLNDQNCVIVMSLWNKAELLKRAQQGMYDMTQVQSLQQRDAWDGMTNKWLLKEKLKNEDIKSASPIRLTSLFMVFDVFMRVPDAGGVWDEEAGDYKWRVATVVGNVIGNGKVLRYDENDDPDGELPIKMLHDRPDDEDFLYHMSRASIVRSNYSVECTLKNQMIDNGAMCNRPPMKEIEGQVRGTDSECAPNTVFIMDQADSLEWFDIKPLGQQNIALIEYIKEDTKMALNTDSLMMGQSAGARTSAYEISKLDKYSSTPHLIDIEYVLNQFLTWYGRKFLSYWRKYRLPKQVVAITDENIIKEVQTDGLYGEFDVEIDIVNDFQSDMAETTAIEQAFTLIAANPAFQQVVDSAELLTEWFKKKNLDYTKIIKRSTDFDATEVANTENIAMLEGGVPAHPKPGENSDVHLKIHQNFRTQYNGLEKQYPNLMLVDQHIQETEQVISQPMGAQQGAQQPAMPEQPPTQGGGQMQQMMGGTNAVGGTQAGAGVPAGS